MSLVKVFSIFTFGLLLTIYPLLVRIPKQKPELGPQVSNVFWIFFFLIQLSLIFYTFSIQKKGSKASYLLVVVLVVLVLYCAYPLSNLPVFVTQANTDFFHHLSLARTTAYQNNLPELPGEGYVHYPGWTLFTAIFLKLTGGNISLYPAYLGVGLYALLNVFNALCLYKIGFLFLGRSGFLLPMFFYLGNTATGGTVNLYGPSMFGLSLYLVIALTVFRMLKGKLDGKENFMRGFFISALFITAIVTSHPISNFFLFLTLIGIYFLEVVLNRNRREMMERKDRSSLEYSFILPLMLFLLIFSLCWEIFYTPGWFSQLFSSLFSVSASVENVLFTPIVYNWFTSVVRGSTLAFYVFLALSGCYGVILLIKQKLQHTVRVWLGVLVAFALFGSLLLFLASGMWSDRLILFGFIPLSCLSIYAFIRYKKFLKILPFVLIIWMPIPFLFNHMYDFTGSVHSWDVDTCMFAENHTHRPCEVTSNNQFFLFVYSYFTYPDFFDPWQCKIVSSLEMLKYNKVNCTMHIYTSIYGNLDYYTFSNRPSHEIDHHPAYKKIFDNYYNQLFVNLTYSDISD